MGAVERDGGDRGAAGCRAATGARRGIPARAVGTAGQYAVRTGGGGAGIDGAPFAPSSMLNQIAARGRGALAGASGASCAVRGGQTRRRRSARLLDRLRRPPHPVRRSCPGCTCWCARRSNWKPRLRCARQHHARLSGSLRPAAFARARAGGGHRRARGQPARAQARRGAIVDFLLRLRVPHSGALRRPARGAARVARRAN